MKRYLMFVYSGLIVVCPLVHAAVPLRWTVETSRAAPVTFDAYRGETLALTADFSSYGAPLALAGAAALYVQTNGMKSAWWTIPATVVSNRIVATLAPTNYPGEATALTCYLGGPALNYRAAFRVRLLGAPGATPNALALPVGTIDFSTIDVLNAPYYTRDETQTVLDELRAHAESYLCSSNTKVALEWRAQNEYVLAMKWRPADATLFAWGADVGATPFLRCYAGDWSWLRNANTTLQSDLDELRSELAARIDNVANTQITIDPQAATVINSLAGSGVINTRTGVTTVGALLAALALAVAALRRESVRSVNGLVPVNGALTLSARDIPQTLADSTVSSGRITLVDGQITFVDLFYGQSATVVMPALKGGRARDLALLVRTNEYSAGYLNFYLYDISGYKVTYTGDTMPQLRADKCYLIFFTEIRTGLFYRRVVQNATVPRASGGYDSYSSDSFSSDSGWSDSAWDDSFSSDSGWDDSFSSDSGWDDSFSSDSGWGDSW